ncbi:hypothetical protein LTR95_012510 [Oleoguttula sp. CCFEE 5521]
MGEVNLNKRFQTCYEDFGESNFDEVSADTIHEKLDSIIIPMADYDPTLQAPPGWKPYSDFEAVKTAAEEAAARIADATGESDVALEEKKEDGGDGHIDSDEKSARSEQGGSKRSKKAKKVAAKNKKSGGKGKSDAKGKNMGKDKAKGKDFTSSEV